MPIPNSLRVPGHYVEIESLERNLGDNLKKALLFLPKEAHLNLDTNRIYPIANKGILTKLIPFESLALRLASRFLKENQETPLDLLFLEPKPGSLEAKSTITLSGTFLKGDSFCLLIDGREILLSAKNDEDIATISDRLLKEIEKLGFVVTLKSDSLNTDGAGHMLLEITTSMKGLIGNQTLIQLKKPSLSLKLAVDSFKGGLGEQEVAVALSQIQNEHYHYLILPFSDEPTLKLFEDELSSRFSPMRQLGARAFASFCGDDQALLEVAKNLNSPHLSLLGVKGANLSSYEVSVLNASRAIPILSSDPSSSLEGLKLYGLSCDPIDFSTRNQLLHRGVSTYCVQRGSVLIERQVSTYQTNESMEKSASYLDIQVSETLDAIRSIQKERTRSEFHGYKLGEDSKELVPNQKILTPSIYKAFLLSLYKKTFSQEKGWVQDYESYKKALKVSIDPSDKSRLIFQDEPTLISRLMVVSGYTKFES